jgi:nitrate/TMAO reductase-like tetraheme cytochrome c subunit
MTHAAPTQGKKPLRRIQVLIVVLVAVAVMATGGFVFAATQESHDSFCASCHTQPESTFVQRSTSTPAVDLASYHTPQNSLCIDCHSGPGVFGRMQTELMGARNAFIWYIGTAVQPAVTNFPISDASCLKCHQTVTQQGFIPKESMTVPGNASGGGERAGRSNHWHAYLTRWQAADAHAGTCVTCHAGHSMDVGVQNGFMSDQNVQAACDACHRAIRRGE